MRRDEYSIAFERTFKIRSDKRSQSVRLLPNEKFGERDTDEFKVMFQDVKPLNESNKNHFANCCSVEGVKQWLTTPAPAGLGGKLISQPLSESPTREKRRKQPKLQFPAIEPFVQSKDSPLDYSERFDVLRSLCFETCQNLVAMQSTGVNAPQQTAGMIFPQTRNGSVRVSEQEARFQFCIAASNVPKITLAVEVPTTRCYRQKKDGKKWMSGRTDVAFFEYTDRWRRILNIEFKAGQTGQAGRAREASVKNFAKDLEQLLREQIPAAWFHLLNDKTRLNSVVANMREGFKEAILVPFKLPPHLEKEDIFRVDIEIAICVLNGIDSGNGISSGADLYSKRIEYRRPNPEQFDLIDFNRFIDDELQKPEQWEREKFYP